MMADQFAEWINWLDYWLWFIAAVILVVIEVFAPGAVFMWVGISAGLVGLLAWGFPELTWQYEWLIFGCLAIASVAISRQYLRRHPIHSDRPNLNRRGQSYVGRDFVLADPIIDGRGHLRIDDTIWRIIGPDTPAGGKVRVTGLDGTVLLVDDLTDNS